MAEQETGLQEKPDEAADPRDVPVTAAQTVGSAISGASAGAIIGAIFGPVGTVTGSLIGGAVGGFLQSHFGKALQRPEKSDEPVEPGKGGEE
ncbi:MAG TPA: hypothetical protein VKK31_14035 [Thermoanaerobaculia bacterium]|nr:hypothetical protein [Thermoanaerobaculia bacterium]